MSQEEEGGGRGGLADGYNFISINFARKVEFLSDFHKVCYNKKASAGRHVQGVSRTRYRGNKVLH